MVIGIALFIVTATLVCSFFLGIGLFWLGGGEVLMC